jgi:hypothetical protein
MVAASQLFGLLETMNGRYWSGPEHYHTWWREILVDATRWGV